MAESLTTRQGEIQHRLLPWAVQSGYGWYVRHFSKIWLLQNHFFLPGFFGDLIPFFIFLLASFTDYLDGLLARLFKEESKLGELLDPIADKIIIAAALILLVMNGTIKNYEVIAAIIILTREILISGLREFLSSINVSFGEAFIKLFVE